MHSRVSKIILPGISLLFAGLTSLSAQQQTKKYGASLSLETATGKQIQGGVLYDGEVVKGKILFDPAKWDGASRFYPYVFHYTEGQEISLFYPLGNDSPVFTQLPKKNNDGSYQQQITLFEAVISPPYGKDNFILLMTENPIPNIQAMLRGKGKSGSALEGLLGDASRVSRGDFDIRQELMKLAKGSKLSVFSDPSFGMVSVGTLQFESRPAEEKGGLTKGAAMKSVFALPDSSEIFFTPRPQKDIVRDSFPTVEIIDPVLDTATMKGARVLSVANAQKITVRGIAANWKQGNNAIKSITINGRPATTFRAASGYFDYLYEPKEGLNIADVRVENSQGYARIIRLKFQYQSANKEVKKEGKDYLFVIGINKYSGWPVLHNAAKDAKDFRKLMADEYGFNKDNIHDLFDEQATRKEIYSRLRNYVEKLDENDRLLIYFSGHGYYDSTLETGYWIPADAHSGADDEYINNLEITRMLQKMKAKNIFVIADACYSGQLLRDMQKENAGKYKSRIVLCSGKLRPVPDGTPGTNSPFALQVLDFLRKPGTGTLLASELIQQVKSSFKGNDGQKPVGGAIDEVGDENGDYVFHHEKK